MCLVKHERRAEGRSKYLTNYPKLLQGPYSSRKSNGYNLNQPQFQVADKAREYLEALRWANGVICLHCGSLGTHQKLEGNANYRPGMFKCADCREQFTVTVGTVFERSKVGLHIWLQAVHLMSARKKGISAK